jgi:hypothetical protein
MTREIIYDNNMNLPNRYSVEIIDRRFEYYHGLYYKVELFIKCRGMLVYLVDTHREATDILALFSNHVNTIEKIY